jgi:hypothetical protein
MLSPRASSVVRNPRHRTSLGCCLNHGPWRQIDRHEHPNFSGPSIERRGHPAYASLMRRCYRYGLHRGASGLCEIASRSKRRKRTAETDTTRNPDHPHGHNVGCSLLVTPDVRSVSVCAARSKIARCADHTLCAPHGGSGARSRCVL